MIEFGTFSFGLFLFLIINLILSVKKEIFRAFYLYESRQKITERKISYFSIGLTDFLYLIKSIPSYRKNTEFYLEEIVRRKRKKYKLLLKILDLCLLI